MPGKSRYTKKRNYKKSVKKSYKKKTYKKSVPVSVKKYVNNIIARNVETKTAIPASANNVEIQPYGVANPHGSTVIDFSPVWNSIAQGTQNGMRVGDQIKVQSLKFRGFVNFDSSNANNENYLKNPLYLKMIILRRKDSQTNPCFYGTTGINDLMMNGATPTNPQSTPSDMWRYLNKDTYRIYKTKMFKIGSSVTSNTPSESNLYNNDFKLSQKFSIDLSKHIDVLKYQPGQVTVNNQAMFCIFLVCFANGYPISLLVKPCVEIHYDIEMKYEDA